MAITFDPGAPPATVFDKGAARVKGRFDQES